MVLSKNMPGWTAENQENIKQESQNFEPQTT
jgi:hypothetical protein